MDAQALTAILFGCVRGAEGALSEISEVHAALALILVVMSCNGCV